MYWNDRREKNPPWPNCPRQPAGHQICRVVDDAISMLRRLYCFELRITSRKSYSQFSIRRSRPGPSRGNVCLAGCITQTCHICAKRRVLRNCSRAPRRDSKYSKFSGLLLPRRLESAVQCPWPMCRSGHKNIGLEFHPLLVPDPISKKRAIIDEENLQFLSR